MGLWQLGAAAAIVVIGARLMRVVRTDRVIAADLRTAVRRPRTWLVTLPAMALVMLVGVPFVYFESIRTDPPPPLSFANLSPTSTTATAPSTRKSSAGADEAGEAAPIDALAGPSSTAPPTTAAPNNAQASPVAGTWMVGSGSEARYSIDDTALGQTSRVVGSTTAVSGSMAITDTTVTGATVVVDMRSVKCNCTHDEKYHDMLDTDVYPTSTFELTRPIELSSIPPDGKVIQVPVRGDMTIHGVTRAVSFTLEALRQDGRIAIKGAIPVELEDYNIENPDAGAFGKLDNCSIEFLVAFDQPA